MRLRRQLCLASLSILFVSSVASADLGLGVFVPEVPFAGPAQRFAFVQALAQHLSQSLGTAVQPFAYKSARDLERDVRTGKIQMAVLGSVYLAGRPALAPAAQAVLRNSSDGVWSILCAGKKSLPELKGEPMQVPSLGPLVISILQHGLLGGAVDPRKHFRIQQAPDLASSLAAVRLGRAAAAFGPISTPGMVPVMRGISLPPPAFVILDQKKLGPLAAKAVSSVASYGAATANLVGWKSGEASPYRGLAEASRKVALKMSLAAPAVLKLDLTPLLLRADALSTEFPELEDLFWVP